MKKLTLLLVSALLLSGCLKKPTVPGTSSDSTDSSSDQTISGKFTDLLNLGKNLKCTWKLSEEGVVMEGVVYVSGKKALSSMTADLPDGQKMENYSLSDGETVYSWSNTQQGTKFKISDFDQYQPDPSQEQQQQMETFQKDYNYKCSPWIVDSSKFTLPSDIQFTDMGQQMQQMQQSVEKMKDSLQDICSSLPEPQKTECLKGMD